MLIDSYDLEVTTDPGERESEERVAFVRFPGVDLAPLLPYLNRVLDGAIYNPRAPSLGWRDGRRQIAFWPHQIAIDHLQDPEEARAVAQQVVDVVNRTWEQRERIEPDHRTRVLPGPLEVYRLLPRTNCKACGQQTCFVFAGKLLAGQVSVDACLPLGEPGAEAQRAQLIALLER